jgi:hypothetical protein
MGIVGIAETLCMAADADRRRIRSKDTLYSGAGAPDTNYHRDSRFHRAPRVRRSYGDGTGTGARNGKPRRTAEQRN